MQAFRQKSSWFREDFLYQFTYNLHWGWRDYISSHITHFVMWRLQNTLFSIYFSRSACVIQKKAVPLQCNSKEQ